VGSIQHKPGRVVIKVAWLPGFKQMATFTICDTFNFKLIVMYVVVAGGTILF
jgi:hypothetical protein